MHPLLAKQRMLLNPEAERERRRQEVIELLVKGYKELIERIEKLEARIEC